MDNEQFASKSKNGEIKKSEMQIVSKERKEEILSLLNKAGSEEYETSWDEKGVPQSKKKTEIAKGKKSRQKGADFELKVRKDLESKNWIVAKWPNNVNLEEKKIIPAKRKFNPFSKAMTLGTGFPDFISFQRLENNFYNVIGVESKINGTLSHEEKEKCGFLIAEKNEETREIVYVSFKEKFGDKFCVEKS